MRRGLERRQSWGRRRSAGFSLACRRPHAPNTPGPSQARAACGSRPGPGSSLSSLGSEVPTEMPAGGGQLRDGDSCPPGLTRSDGPPSPAGAPAAPSVMAHQDCVHPLLLLVPRPASSQRSKQSDTFSKFSGHCCFLLKFLTAPQRPPPAMGKAAVPGHLLVLAQGGGGAAGRAQQL